MRSHPAGQEGRATLTGGTGWTALLSNVLGKADPRTATERISALGCSEKAFPLLSGPGDKVKSVPKMNSSPHPLSH